MTDIKDRAREYLRSQTQLNGGGLFHCNILNLILGFAEQETKELEKENAELKSLLNCPNCCEYDEDECATCTDFSHFKCKGNHQLIKAMKHLKDLVYVVELGKNELATARILAEAKEFLKEE